MLHHLSLMRNGAAFAYHEMLFLLYITLLHSTRLHPLNGILYFKFGERDLDADG